MPKIVAEKSEWIALGYKLFARYGEAGIIVDKISASLKCNRSSFYWHFKTKKGFICEVIDYWVKSDTELIIEMVASIKDPKVKFMALIEIVFKKDPHIDFIFHLKRYAIANKQIQHLIDQIDDRRINYVHALLTNLGYTPEEARIKAHLFYKFLIGYHEMIRYKEQEQGYLQHVLTELNQFIAI